MMIQTGRQSPSLRRVAALTEDLFSSGRLQLAHLSGFFEPPTLSAVDLHQLANAVAPALRLVNVLPPLLAVSPDPGLDHSQP